MFLQLRSTVARFFRVFCVIPPALRKFSFPCIRGDSVPVSARFTTAAWFSGVPRFESAYIFCFIEGVISLGSAEDSSLQALVLHLTVVASDFPSGDLRACKGFVCMQYLQT